MTKSSYNKGKGYHLVTGKGKSRYFSTKTKALAAYKKAKSPASLFKKGTQIRGKYKKR